MRPRARGRDRLGAGGLTRSVRLTACRQAAIPFNCTASTDRLPACQLQEEPFITPQADKPLKSIRSSILIGARAATGIGAWARAARRARWSQTAGTRTASGAATCRCRRYSISVAMSPNTAARVIHRPGAALSPVISMSPVATAGVKPPNRAVARL